MVLWGLALRMAAPAQAQAQPPEPASDPALDSESGPEAPPPVAPPPVAPEPTAPAADEPPPTTLRSTARSGFGIDLGGGGVLGATAAIRLGELTWLDLGLHARVAITPASAPNHIAPMATIGLVQELGDGSTRGAFFATAGATPPGDYVDSLVAGGLAARLWSRKRVAVHTLAAGPGWMPMRRIPGAAPGPPFLIFWRYAVHFHGSRRVERVPVEP